MTAVEFSSQMDSDVLEQLRTHAEREGRTFSSVLTAASAEYLERVNVRPVFRDAAREVLEEHAELLARLAH